MVGGVFFYTAEKLQKCLKPQKIAREFPRASTTLGRTRIPSGKRRDFGDEQLADDLRIGSFGLPHHLADQRADRLLLAPFEVGHDLGVFGQDGFDDRGQLPRVGGDGEGPYCDDLLDVRGGCRGGGRRSSRSAKTMRPLLFVIFRWLIFLSRASSTAAGMGNLPIATFRSFISRRTSCVTQLQACLASPHTPATCSK